MEILFLIALAGILFFVLFLLERTKQAPAIKLSANMKSVLKYGGVVLGIGILLWLGRGLLPGTAVLKDKLSESIGRFSEITVLWPYALGVIVIALIVWLKPRGIKGSPFQFTRIAKMAILVFAHLFIGFLVFEFFPETYEWQQENARLFWILVSCYLAILLIGWFLPGWRIILIPIIIGIVILQLSGDESWKLWGRTGEVRTFSEKKIDRFLIYHIPSKPNDLRRKEKKGEIENLYLFAQGRVIKDKPSGLVTAPEPASGVRYRMRPVVLGECKLEILSEDGRTLGFYPGCGEFQYSPEWGTRIRFKTVDCPETGVNIWGWTEKIRPAE